MSIKSFVEELNRINAEIKNNNIKQNARKCPRA